MTSKYLQITDGILVEYIYTSILTPEEYSVNLYQTEIVKDVKNDISYFFNTPDNYNTTTNVRDYSSVYISDKIWISLNRDLPLEYIDYDNNFTGTNDILQTTFVPNYHIKYDNIRIHFASNFNFDARDGFIFDINIKRRDDKDINLSSITYKKSDDFAVLNPNPRIIGERLYNRYIDLKIPALYFLLLEDKSANNILHRLSNGLGLISSTKININLYEIISTQKINSYSNYTVNRLNQVAFNYKDEFELLLARIQESTQGDYFEFYGEYDNKIFEDFISFLNNQPNSDFVVFHELTVNEQIGTNFIETAKNLSLQTSDYGKPMKFRPIIENASQAVSYSINYVLRLINRIDNLQIIKTSQVISYDTKKYGRSLKRLYLQTPPIINKIYNKIENTNYTSGTMDKDKLMMTNIVKQEYVNIFNDKANIVISESNINIDNFQNTTDTSNLVDSSGSVINISPFDDFILFSFYKKSNTDILSINLSLYGEIYLNFLDSEEIKIKEYQNQSNLHENQRIFKISKENTRKLKSFTNNKYYITHKITNPDAESDEGSLFFGTFTLI